MRLIGSVNAKTRKIGATSEAAFARERRGFFPRDRQRVQDANRRGVINHTIKFLRQIHPLSNPIDHQRFEFSRRR